MHLDQKNWWQEFFPNDAYVCQEYFSFAALYNDEYIMKIYKVDHV